MSTPEPSTVRADSDVPSGASRATDLRPLARVTGVAGLVTFAVLIGGSLANGFQNAAFTADAPTVVAFFGSLDRPLGWVASYAVPLGLIAMLWFAVGLALILRRYEDALPWRSAFLAGAGVISVVSGQIAAWDAAVFRAGDLDPQVARYAFDLGNLSFANSWVATGALGLCAGMVIRRSRALPSWLGWWGLLAGAGQVLARAWWTQAFALIPFFAFWIWTVAVSVLLLRGRFDGPEGDAIAH